MGAINLGQLLMEVSPGSACGENLSYDPEYMELERIAQGSPEQQVGKTVVEAADPNWKEVRDRCNALLGRTKDLRVALYLTLSLLKTEGLEGLAGGLALVRGLLETYWDHVHPELDLEDPDAPALERINIIASLAPPPGTFNDAMQFGGRIADVKLSASRETGAFSLRDIRLANGEITPPAGGNPPKMALIDASFAATDADLLRSRAEAVTAAIQHVMAIEVLLTDKAGAGQAPDLRGLVDILQQVQKVLSGYLAKRGYESVTESADTQERPERPETPAADAAPVASTSSGEVRSRPDVLRALEAVCKYYEQSEPSSPVPLLVRRAQRLVGRPFMEIVRDLSPDAVSQVEKLGGTKAADAP